MAAEQKEKRIHRLAPCPSYDVERLESWLQDMARDGWALEKDGCIFGFLSFLQVPPQPVRYRLEPKAPGDSFGDIPDEDFQTLCQEYGWEYVDSYAEFYIYRATRPDAREMNTDLQVQAASLKAGKRDSGLTVILDVILLVSVYADCIWQPVRSLVAFGLIYHLLLLITLLWSTAETILRARHLRQLSRQLKANIPLDHNKPWKKGAAFHRAGKVSYVLLILLLFGTIFGSCTRSMDTDAIDVADYPGDPPFATFTDLCPEGAYTARNFLNTYNTYNTNSNFFAPQIIEWKEYGSLVTPEGDVIEGSLYITWYETRAPWLAQGLLEDLLRDAQQDKHYAPLTAPDIDVDACAAYNNIYPTVLIRQGNVLVQATVGLKCGDEYLLEQWAQQMAEMLTCE